jgi:hypothetical protein
MKPTETERLLAALHRGATSRNRHFERFNDPRARRVLRAHRRLRSLIAEISRPGALVEARWSEDRYTLTVLCRQPALRYWRRLDLAPWEAAFLLREIGQGRITPEMAAPC